MTVANNAELVLILKRHNRYVAGAFMASALLLPFVYLLIQVHSMELEIATKDFAGFQNCEYSLSNRTSSLVRLCSARSQVEIYALSFSDLGCVQKLDQACAAINSLADRKFAIESLMGGLVLVWMICCAFIDKTMHQIAAALEAREDDVQEGRPLVGA